MAFSDKSCYFNGVDEYVDLGNSYNFDRDDAFSISFWLKTTTIDTWRKVIARQDVGAPEGWNVELDGGGHIQLQLVDIWATSRVQMISSGADMRDGLWHHVIITWSGVTGLAADCSMYIDGVSNALTTSADTLSSSISNNFDCYIAARALDQGTGHDFEGNMDEVAFYSKELSAAEAVGIFNGKLPNDLDTLSSARSLVGWWRCGDGDTSPTLIDNAIRSANPHPVMHDASGPFNGTMINMVRGDIQGDVPGRSLSCLFDGTNEYVTMGNVLDFDYNDPFTISCWVKSTDNTAYLVSKKSNAAGQYRGYGLLYWGGGTGEVTFLLTNDGDPAGTTEIQVESVAAYNDGKWHHICATYDGSNVASGVTIYVDGVSVSTITVWDTLGANTTVNSASFNISGRTDGDTLLDGNIDEVGIYDKELSPAEVADVYNEGSPNDLSSLSSSANLVGWWRMGDGDTYPTLTDNSVNSNDGTMTNMEVMDIVGDAPTPFSKWSMLTGLDSYVGTCYANIGNVLNFDHNEPFSISLWFKTNGAFISYILSKWSQTTRTGYAIYYGPTGQLTIFFESSASNGIQLRTANGFGDGKWHHMVMTYNGNGSSSGFDVYVDNVPEVLTVIKSTLLGNTTITTANLQIGARDNGLDRFNGVVDEVAVYDTDLSAGDVNSIYNNGEPNNLALLSSYSDLVGWWRCGDGDVYPTLTDNSTNSNDGTMINAVRRDLIRDAPKSYTDHSSLFTGANNEYITMGNVLDFERTDTFSISCWIRTTEAAGWDSIVGKRDGAPFYAGYLLSLTSAGAIAVILRDVTGVLIEVDTNNTYNDGQWHHVVMTYNGNTSITGFTIYIDGSSVLTTATGTIIANSISNSSDLVIGASPVVGGVPSYEFTGPIDEVAIYNDLLVPAEVLEIYNSGVPTDLGRLSSVANLVAWWRMGDGSQ